MAGRIRLPAAGNCRAGAARLSSAIQRCLKVPKSRRCCAAPATTGTVPRAPSAKKAAAHLSRPLPLPDLRFLTCSATPPLRSSCYVWASGGMCLSTAHRPGLLLCGWWLCAFHDQIQEKCRTQEKEPRKHGYMAANRHRRNLRAPSWHPCF